ncbi:MAG: GntR family transcriptional regulator [Gemmatimonadetes bacterium]|nr:GntR family transcriptional regulator [Gemmatimonadota bacterium]
MTDGTEGASRDKSSTERRSTQAYRRLRKLIVSGRLAPGSRLMESDLAERLGVSRTPVRSALQRLEQEGYILSENSGQRWRPKVAPLTREDSAELFYIIGEVEGLAGWFAAALEGDEHGELVETLDSINQRLREASKRESQAAEVYYNLDHAFHRAYVDAGAGPRLRSLHDAIKPQAERYIRVYVSALTTEIETSIAEHDNIVRAIEGRNSDLAQRMIEANWRGAAERLGRVIEWVGERGSW